MITQRRWILFLCCLAQFMVILDVSVVNVALPSIRADLGFSGADLQWVVNAYTLTFAGLLLLGGRAADLLGARPVFIGALLLFALASLAGALSTSQDMLVIARGVQGIGGAVVAPVTLAILATTFTEGAERNRALGIWGAMGGAGGAAGVLLGGILTDLLGWEWILLINVPIGIGAAIGARRFVPRREAHPHGERYYDALGAFTVTAGLIVLTYAIVRTEVNGWGSGKTLGLAAIAVALLAAFVAIEHRFARRPLVPLRIFANRTLTAANVVVFFLGSSVFAMWYFVSLYLQGVLGYSPIEAGLSFLPMTAAIILASTAAGRLVQRFGARPVLIAGMASIGLGMLGFSTLQGDGDYFPHVLIPGLLCAVGIGFSFVPGTIAAVAGVQPQESGLASGLVNTSRQLGGSLGLAVLATVASQHHGPVTDGYDVAFRIGAAFGFAGAVTAAFALPRLRRRHAPEPAPHPSS